MKREEKYAVKILADGLERYFKRVFLSRKK
jgi:hypothetical protein